MTPTDFIALLEAHNWYFDRSDHNCAYAKGLQSQKRLLYLCQQQPELFRLYNHADNCIIAGLPFNFPSVTGTTLVKEENQHTQTTTPMSDLLQSVLATFVQPIVDAIDRNTAAKGGAPYEGPTSTPPSEPAPMPVEKPAKTPKAPKPAAPPASPVEESAEPAVVTEARLRATVKTLSPEAKQSLGEKIQKKLGVQTMGEIPAEHRAGVHAQAIKLGAIDTDPDAPASAAVNFGD